MIKCNNGFSDTNKYIALFVIPVIKSYRRCYCILSGQTKGYSSSITAIMCQIGSYRTVIE